MSLNTSRHGLCVRVLAACLAVSFFQPPPIWALAPPSPYAGQDAKPKPKGPSKPLREDLSKEEIAALAIYEQLDAINLSIYTAMMARTHSRRQKEELEKQVRAGDKGLRNDLKDIARVEKAWDGQIKKHTKALRALREGFPALRAGESPLLSEAREFLGRAIPMIEANRVAAAGPLMAGAKRRMLRKFRELLSDHLQSIPRIRATTIPGKSALGEEVQTITFAGFGMRILKNGRVTTPLRDYHKDRDMDKWVLKWKNVKLDGLPAAMRQALHIGISEEKEFQAVLGFIKAIVDLGGQLREQEGVLNTAQRETMAHLVLLLILRISPEAFADVVAKQRDAMTKAVKPILSQMGIRGDARKKFLKKIRAEFVQAQENLATSDDLILHRDKRIAAGNQFSVRWEKLLQEEIETLGIKMSDDDNARWKHLQTQWHRARDDHLITDLNELMVRVGPYGLIKDDEKRRALLHLRLAGELLVTGRVDRNVGDFLEGAKAYLYKRVANTKGIRDAMKKRFAAMQAEKELIENRDADIEDAAAQIRDQLLIARDPESAVQVLLALFRKHFRRRHQAPGLQRVAKRLDALLNLLPAIVPTSKRLAQAESKIRNAQELRAKQMDALAALQAELEQIDFELGAPAFLEGIEQAQELLADLHKNAEPWADQEAFFMTKNFLKALPKKVPDKANQVELLRDNLQGLGIRMQGFLRDLSEQEFLPEQEAKIRDSLRPVINVLPAVAQAAKRYGDLLHEPERLAELEKRRAVIEGELPDMREEAGQLDAAVGLFAEARRQALMDFNSAVESRILPNLSAMHQDILHKYEEVDPTKREREEGIQEGRGIPSRRTRLSTVRPPASPAVVPTAAGLLAVSL